MQATCLSRPLGRMPPHCICQLFNTVVVSTITYVANIWFTSIHEALSRKKRLGSVTIVNKLVPNPKTGCQINHWLPEHENTFQTMQTTVYCDGSGYKDSIGVAVVLYIDGRESDTLKYHFGPTMQHIVYQAKIIGILLGLHLLANLADRLPAQSALGSDSQATIKALLNQQPHSAHYLLDWSDRTCGVIELQIHWTLGHTNFQLNKHVDELAKKAAGGMSSPAEMILKTLRKGPLPTNISAAHQAALEATKAD
ncbi:hypothetical protein J132_00731 [Termitomyces sp. J132]|nr:hypothetical protein J132_00731 [Termitomyces sp. J132]